MAQGHGMQGDLGILRRLGVSVPPGMRLADTLQLNWAIVGGFGRDKNNATVRPAGGMVDLGDISYY